MNRYEREYSRPLYEEGICVPPTERADVDPLTYALVFPQGSEGGKTCSLAFYDAYGKNFGSEADMALYNRSIYHSRGILLILDPGRLPGLQDVRGAKPAPGAEEDAQTLLLRTVHLLRAGLGLESVDKKIPIPLAVVITKMDTLYHRLDPSSFLRDSSRNLRRPMISAADISSCSLEAQSLLESWGARELLGHVKSQFSDWAFFGVSALGEKPGPQGEIRRVTPHRVLDPLLWLLWKNGVLRAG